MFPNTFPPPPPAPSYEVPGKLVETSKSTEVVDAFGQLRYVVNLSSQVSSIAISGEVVDARVYQTVVQMPLSSGLSAFLQIPADGHEVDYAKAQCDFKTCVERYSSLVWAEMKDFNNIDIYAEAVQYEVLKPDCCMNCKYGCPSIACPGKYECHSPKNQQVFNYGHAFPQLPNKDIYAYGHPNSAWQKLPWQAGVPCYGQKLPLPTQTMNRIYPTVDALGTCSDFTKKDETPKP